jgi:hypothetical protein
MRWGMIKGSNKFKLILSGIFICISFALYADDGAYTVSDVVNAQAQTVGDIQTLSATVNSVTEYNGATQPLSYDYALQTDENGNNKVMVTTKGVFTMQFLVDTADMSITYLMADGSQRKVTVSAEDSVQIRQMAGIGNMTAFGKQGSMYAALGLKKSELSDGTYKNMLNTDKFETDNVAVQVRGKKGSGKGLLGLGNGDDIAEVEYQDKKVKENAFKIQEAADKIRLAKPNNKAAEDYKAKTLAWFDKNKDKAFKTMIARRVEHVNMKTGIVEEQEMYNPNGEVVGHMKVKSKRKIRAGKRIKDNNGVMRTSTDPASMKDFELPQESEMETDTGNGKSKMSIKLENMAVNQDTKFEWMKVKNSGGK